MHLWGMKNTLFGGSIRFVFMAALCCLLSGCFGDGAREILIELDYYGKPLSSRCYFATGQNGTVEVFGFVSDASGSSRRVKVLVSRVSGTNFVVEVFESVHGQEVEVTRLSMGIEHRTPNGTTATASSADGKVAITVKKVQAGGEVEAPAPR
jgi:hypothetical protein